MAAICNLVFDWGGVLSVSNHAQAMERFAQLGLKNPERFFSLSSSPSADGVNWQGIFGGVEQGTLSAEQFLQSFSSLCGHSVSFEQVAWAWWGFFDHLTVGLPSALIRWQRHYRLFVLTNNNPFMFSQICSESFQVQGRSFHSFFNQLFASYQLQLLKPSPLIFHKVEQLAHLQPDKTLFIDDLPANLEGAKSCGWHTFRVKNGEDWIPLFESELFRINRL